MNKCRYILVVTGMIMLYTASFLTAQEAKKKKKTYAIFSLEEPKLIKQAGVKKKVKTFPLPPGAKRTKDKKEEIRDNIGEMQVYYVDMDIMKVREFYKSTLGTEGEVNKGNPLIGAGGNWVTIPVETTNWTNPKTGKQYKNIMLFGANMSWMNDEKGNGKTRIMVQFIRDKEAMKKDLAQREEFMKTEGGPKHIKSEGEKEEKP